MGSFKKISVNKIVTKLELCLGNALSKNVNKKNKKNYIQKRSFCNVTTFAKLHSCGNKNFVFVLALLRSLC